MKKFLSIALCAVMVLGILAGCGQKGNDTPKNDDNSTALSGSVSTNGSTSMDKVIGALKEQFTIDNPNVTVEQRERALKATHYNEFAFPSGMLTVDMLSDSGTTAMTNQQWAALFLGDEAYGRNTGYYVLLDTFRDIFERGGEKNWKKIIDYVRTDCRDVEPMMENVYLPEYEGGLFNGGAAQMERPNTFNIQQGRAAESVLMEIVKKILAQRHPGKVFTIPSNGHFDTTEGNIKQMGSIPRNLYNKTLLWEVPEGGRYETSPFKGNMDIEKLAQLIQSVGPENVPLIFTCITNNPICGQPGSMGNIREINRVAHKYNIPLIFDVARRAENCYFIKMNEESYRDKSIAEIASACFYSESYFMKFFKHARGTSFVQYLNSYRLEKAAKRLRDTSDTILQVAMEPGFDSLSYFNRCFKKMYGPTPGKYRSAAAVHASDHSFRSI